MEVSKVFTENKIDINSLNTHTSKQGVASLDLSFVVSGRDELNHVVEKLRQIPGVMDIERTTG
jgi:GTP pyrophosphokinase